MTAEEFHLPTPLDIVNQAKPGELGHPLKSVEHTDWYLQLDTIDVYIADRETLEQLAKTAPSMRCHDYLQGIIDTRTMFSVVTGNSF